MHWRMTGVALCTALTASSALANPTGGVVTSGQATIQQNGNTLQVTTATQNTTINWQNFSIGAGETTNFTQPSSSSVVVNQVTTQNPSQIFGSLTSNGQVFLSNPNGVVFGLGSQVNTSGFTLDIGSQGSATLGGVIVTSPGPLTIVGGSFSGSGSINITTTGSATTLSGATFTTTGTVLGGTGVSYAGTTLTTTSSGGPSSGVVVGASSPTAPMGGAGQPGERGGAPMAVSSSASLATGVAVNLEKREPYY